MRVLSSRSVLAAALAFGVVSSASAQTQPAKSPLVYRYMISNRAMPFVAGTRDWRSGFLSVEIDAPQPFEPLVGSRPERICDRLDEAGFANLGWRQAEIATAGWECVSVVARTEEGVDEDASINSLFYMLRGKGIRRMSSARLKISVPQPATRSDIAKQAAELLTVLGVSIGVETPREILDATRALTPIQFATPRAFYGLRQESGEEPRYNLSVEFGLPRNVFVQDWYTRLARQDAPTAGPENGRAGEKGDRLQRSR